MKSITQIKSFDNNYSFMTFNSKKPIIIEKKEIKKKNIKIIDLRKNEHFGDILMILNEKSPVSIRVRSKKAELLFLQKTEATEISNLYPNIWKKIATKSLYNLNQIKNIIKEKIIHFCELNDIKINTDLQKDSPDNSNNKVVKFKPNTIHKKGKKNKKFHIPSIIPEVDESKFVSGKNSTISKNSINKLSFHKNNLSGRKSNFKTSSNNKEKKVQLFSEDEDNENINKSNFSGQNKNKTDHIRKASKTNEYSNFEKLNNNSEDNNFKRINEEMVFNEDIGTNIINKHITMDNHDNNNFIYNREINNKEKNDDFNSKNNSINAIKKLLKDKDIYHSYSEKNFINNNYINTDRVNEKINIYNNFFISNPPNSDNIAENKLFKNKKFEGLQNSTADSFSINSTYENKIKYLIINILQILLFGK